MYPRSNEITYYYTISSDINGNENDEFAGVDIKI